MMTSYRHATKEELPTILSWAEREGWNPGLDDFDAFWQADPEGFFVASVDGRLAASISVVNHTGDFSFLGLYIAHPDFRGQGYGFALWQHGLAHAGQRTVGLDGVPDQQSNYAASGFELFSATTRYTGDVPARKSTSIKPADKADVQELVALEGKASGIAKDAYLSAWVTDTATRKTLVLRDFDAVRGFCTVRQCASGAKVGPLVASTRQDAETLVGAAVDLAGSRLTLDVPDTSPLLKELCAEWKMSAGFATARMYRGAFTPNPLNRSPYFAVTSLELG